MLLFHTLFPVVLYHCRAFLLILDTALLLVPLAPAPAPLAHSTPLHNISMPPVSSCRSFFHPCFSSSYLFVLTLAQSLHPASSDPWMLFFPATFCSPCMVQRIEKAMANIWKKKKKRFWVTSLKHFRILSISQRCYTDKNTLLIPSTGVSINYSKKCLTKESSGRQEVILLLLLR